MSNSWRERPVVPKRKTDDGGPPGWYSRGYLPHFDGGERTQVITFNLRDALPKSVLDRWKRELAREADKEREIELRKRVDAYLDRGLGSAWMKNRAIAEIVQNAVLKFDGSRYQIHAWV